MITDKAWLIHQKPQGDTSLLLTLFSEQQGLFRGIYRGGRSKNKRSSVQLFSPLWLELKPGRDLFFINKIELSVPPLHFEGLSLICALYVNEVLYHSLKHPDASPELYSEYEHCLSAMQQNPKRPELDILLRRFEWALLSHSGLAFSFDYDYMGQPILQEAYYRFEPGHGFIHSHTGISGDTLLNIHHQNFSEPGVLSITKTIMRQAIDDLLQYRPLKARELLKHLPSTVS